ncbi:MAG: hypothetical protein EOO46_11110 [Flavobacterium sp.]|nr:MAG: hypothetical protein EOO46_11110 [Flavobacterium sp.]
MDCPLEGNRLKKLSSGGNPLTARTHCKEEVEFKPQFKAFLLVNDLQKINPHDAAINTRLRYIPFTTTFVDNNPDESQRRYLKNPNAEDEIQTPLFRKCMLHVFLDAYKNREMNFIAPECVVNCKANWSPKSTDLLEQIKDHCEVTDVESDFVTVKDMSRILKALGNVSSNKFIAMLADKLAQGNIRNIRYHSKKIAGVTIRGWTGIKVVNEKDMEKQLELERRMKECGVDGNLLDAFAVLPEK